MAKGASRHVNRIRRLVGARTGRTQAPPSLLILHPSGRCNLGCYMCFTQPAIKKRGYGRELTLEGLMKLVSDAAEWGVERVWLCGGGEPLMKEGIGTLMSHVKSVGLKGLMSTNGLLFDEGMSELAVEAGWDQVIFSLDAADPETYGTIRGRDCFKAVKENIEGLARMKRRHSSAKPEIIIYSVILPENHGRLEDIVRFGHEVGAAKVIFGNAFPENPASALSPEQEKAALPLYGKTALLAKRLGVATNVGLFARKRQYLDDLVCSKPWTQIGVRYDGLVEPCALSDEVMGDVRHQTLREIWASQRYVEFRMRRHSGEFSKYCENCDIFDQHMFRVSGGILARPVEAARYLLKGSFV